MTASNAVRGGVAPVAAASPAAPVGAGTTAARHAGPRMAFRAFLERAGEEARAEPPVVPVAATPPKHAVPAGTGAIPPDAAPSSEPPDDSDDVRPHSRHGLSDDAAVGAASASPVTPFVPAPLAPLELGPAAATARAGPSLEHLMTALVRRVAWSGDGRRGSARLEIGAGALAGATLIVHSDEGRVRVHLDVPPGVDVSAWRERIARGLAARRIATDEVDVT